MEKQTLERDLSPPPNFCQMCGNVLSPEDSTPNNPTMQSVVVKSTCSSIQAQRDSTSACSDNSYDDLIRLFDYVTRSSASPNNIVQRLVREVRLALQVHSVNYFRRSDNGDYLIVEAADSRDEEDTLELAQLAHPLTPESIPIYRRFWDLISTTHGPAVLDFTDPSHRALLLPASVPWHDRFRARWALCCPMLVGERAIGFLGVRTDDPRGFTESERRVMQSLAQKLTVVVTVDALNRQVAETAIAREREDTAIKRASELSRINLILTESVRRLSYDDDPSRVLDRLVEQVAQVLDAYHVFLFAYDPDTDTLSLQRSWLDGQLHVGMRGEELPLWAASFPSSITPAWRQMCERRDLHTPKNVGIPPEEFAWPGTFEYLSRIGASDTGHMVLFVGDEPVGSMGFALTEGRMLPSQDIVMVEAIGRQAAVALKLVKQSDQARKAAVAKERELAAERRTLELVKANASLSRSLTAVSRLSDFDDTIETIFKEIVITTEAIAGQFFQYDSSNNTLATAFWIDETGSGRGSCPDSPGSIRQSFNADVTPAFRQCVKTGEIIVADHVSMTSEQRALTWPGVIDWHLNRNRVASCAVPILIGSRPVGMIGLAWSQAFQFAPEQRELLNALTNQIALVLQLKELAETQRAAAISREREIAAEQRATDLADTNTALKRTLDAVVSEPDLDKVLGKVLVAITEHLRSPSSAVWLADGQTGRFSARLAYHEGRIIEVSAETKGILKGAWGRGRDLYFKDHMRLRKPFVYQVNELRESDPQAYQFFHELGIHTLLGIPLLLGDEIVGSLTIRFDAPRHLRAEDLELSQAMAHQATMAVQLTRLAEGLEQAAVLGERTRLAREIHDTVAQGLVAILMHTRAASSGDDLSHHLEVVEQLAEENLAEARRSVHALRPTDAGPDGLVGRLRRVSEKLNASSKTVVKVSSSGPYLPLPDLVEDEIGRITQEAATNAVKHAQTAEVLLDLISEADGLMLTISDSGKGFDTERLPDGRYGIVGMIERAERIGAAFTIISEPGRGTKIVLRWQSNHSSREKR